MAQGKQKLAKCPECFGTGTTANKQNGCPYCFDGNMALPYAAAKQLRFGLINAIMYLRASMANKNLYSVEYIQKQTAEMEKLIKETEQYERIEQ